MVRMPEDILDKLKKHKRKKKHRLLDEQAERDITPVKGEIEGKS